MIIKILILNLMSVTCSSTNESSPFLFIRPLKLFHVKCSPILAHHGESHVSERQVVMLLIILMNGLLFNPEDMTVMIPIKSFKGGLYTTAHFSALQHWSPISSGSGKLVYLCMSFWALHHLRGICRPCPSWKVLQDHTHILTFSHRESKS